MKKALTLVLVVMMAFTFIGCGKKGGDTYTIGINMPMSGPTALLGNQAYWGADIARQIFNERGGINGTMVEFVVGDGFDVATAATEANRLIDTYDVDIIIGSLLGTHGIAIRQVTDRSEKILWETSGISKEVLDNNLGYAFRLCDEGPLRGTNSAAFVIEEVCSLLGKKPSELRVGWICPEGDFGRSIGESYVAGVKTHGWTYALEEYYNADSTDFSAIVQHLQQANLDVLFSYGGINNVQLLMDTIIQYKAWPKVIVGLGEGFNDTSFVNNMGVNVVEGVFCVDMPTNVSTEQLRDPKNVALLNEFRERFMKDYSYDYVPLAADLVFMGTWVLLNDVLAKCDKLTVDEIVKVAKSLDIPETTMGWSVKFDERGQNLGASSVLMQWQDGKLVTIWPDNYALGSIKPGSVPLKK